MLVDLQLFAEEDIILPDDFAPPEASTTDTEQVEDTTKTEPVQTDKNTIDYNPLLDALGEKIKFNHASHRPESIDDIAINYQKGMNYDKTIERLKQLETDPRLSFVEAQAKKYNMTPSEYIEAVRQQEEKEQLNQLIQNNIPEQFAREMLENRKFREQMQAEKQTAEVKQKQNAEYEEFLTTYPDVKPEEIPPKVWELQASGKSLTDAYATYENQLLKDKLKTLTHNNEVASRTPIGGVTAHGSAEVGAKDPFEIGFDSI